MYKYLQTQEAPEPLNDLDLIPSLRVENLTCASLGYDTDRN